MAHHQATRRTTELAQRAREVLATGQHAQLWVDGLSTQVGTCSHLRVWDLGGVPHIVCRNTDPLLSRLGGRARIIVRSATPASSSRHTGEQVTVTVDGTLHSAPQIHAPLGDDTVAVALRPAVVFTEQQRSTGPVVTASIPVSLFLSMDLDVLKIHSAVVRAHFNTAHQDRLRMSAAHLTGRRTDEILSALISEVTCESVTLEWIDTVGSHRTPLDFHHRAVSPAELDHLLHECLAVW